MKLRSAVITLLIPLLWGATPGQADSEPPFEVPVQCDLGQNCYIQNYVDRNPGPQAQDYQCGALSVNGYPGTDFRLRTVKEMRQGIKVVAAANGRVRVIRDGISDEPETVNPYLTGQSATKKGGDPASGNGVLIDHGNGWESQYNHLRKGSVRVFPGQAVKAGQVLGEIGQSGNASFPHLQWVVRFKGQPIDPFTGITDISGCGAHRSPLWSPKALEILTYIPTGTLSAGFATRLPDANMVSDPPELTTSLLPEAPALFFWTHIFGVRAGDMELIRLIDPAGKIILEKRETFRKQLPIAIRHIGQKRNRKAWPPGTYIGDYSLLRVGDNDPILSISRRISIPDWK